MVFYDMRKTDEDDDRGFNIKDRIVSWDINKNLEISVFNKPSDYRVLIEEIDFGRGAGNFFDAVEIEKEDFGNRVSGLVNIVGLDNGDGIFQFNVKPVEATINFNIIYDEDRKDPQNDGDSIDESFRETFDIQDFDNEPELSEGYHVNVIGLEVEIDMKGTTNSSEWEYKGTIHWENSYLFD